MIIDHVEANHLDRRFVFASSALCVWLFTLLPAVAGVQSDQVPLRLIVVRTEAEAAEIRSRLQSGEAFEELARKHSVDGSGRSGGYVGSVVIGELREEFQRALEGLHPGEITPVVRAGGAFALLQPLSEAQAREAAVRAWIAAGKDPKSPALAALWQTALLANDTEMVRTLVVAGADVKARFDDGSTVLMGAAQAGHVGIVRALLAAGADVNAKAHNGVTALMEAAFNGRFDVVRILLDAGADARAALNNGSTALMAAAQAGHTEIVRALVGAGADVNAAAANRSTALVEAAYAGHLEAVRFLLKAGANVHAGLNDGRTSVMAAALGGHSDVVRTLLEAGAEVNARDSRDWTPLTYAQAAASSAAVRAVLDAGPAISGLERKIAVGRTYVNEYYSSHESRLLDLAKAEFQAVLEAEPDNVTGLEWMGAIEVLHWGDRPGVQEYRRARSLLKQSVNMDPSDPERHYWIAAINWRFATQGSVPPGESTAIVDEGIEHARKAVELEPSYAKAWTCLSALYKRKGDEAAAEAARREALAATEATKGRPTVRFDDQFTRPASPPPPE